MDYKNDGFGQPDDTNEETDKIQKKDDAYNVSFYIIFSDKFMRKYTVFNSFKEMLEKSGLKIETEEDFEKISDYELDLFIRNNSDFDSWEELVQEAVNNHYAEELGL
ncbi:hypothetical protein LY28_00452 [Ruminiclostridium sufflavum DSM 19573]|uniref:Uncharacterized protein n=1 Tax=Ruminiclostridium sufflavum DSM 19573 TaxID=1121337 RepID=A0A318XPN8_9FIRM|nr:hypothetical protein [Ruminiclostridium sufflavum]PYG89854.1 hypothetical protein LY28_00452 [Ruminiclostridium sufflavum DSM 19573]